MKYQYDGLYERYDGCEGGLLEDEETFIVSASSVGPSFLDGNSSIKRLVFTCPERIDYCCSQMDNLEEIIFLTDSNISINIKGAFSYNQSLQQIIFPYTTDIKIESSFNDNPSLTEVIWPSWADEDYCAKEYSVEDSFNGCPNLSIKYIPPAFKVSGFDGRKLYDMTIFNSLHLYGKLAHIETLLDTRNKIDPDLSRPDLPSLDWWLDLNAELSRQKRENDEKFAELFNNTPLNKWIEEVAKEAISKIEVLTMLHEAEHIISES